MSTHMCAKQSYYSTSQQRSEMQLLSIYYFADLFSNKVLLPNDDVELTT